MKPYPDTEKIYRSHQPFADTIIIPFRNYHLLSLLSKVLVIS